MKIINKLVVSAVLMAAVILLSACQGSFLDNRSAMVSRSGVKAESLLPGDVMMVMKFGTDDLKQHEYLDDMMDYFPSNVFDLIRKEMGNSFDENFEEFGMTYERDLMPALGDGLQVMVSMGGDMIKDEEPVIVAVIIPEDAEKLDEIMRRAVDQGRGDRQSYSGFTIYSNPDNDTFFAMYKDVWVMSPDIDILKKSLGTAGSADSLLANKNYQNGVEKMQGQFGFVFIDPSYVIEQLKNDVEFNEEVGDAEKLIDVAASVMGEFFGLSVEKEGLRIKGAIYIDIKKLEELGFGDIYKDVGPAYLYKDLPGDGTVFYIESAGLKLSMEMLIEMYRDMKGFGDALSMVKIALAAQKLDLEDDILSFMDKGYALNMQVDDGLMPFIGFYTDASSSPESAQKVMKKIADGLDAVIEEGDMPDDVKAALSNGQTECGKGECYSMKFDFSALPEEAKDTISPVFADETLDFQYGLNGNNLAFFTLYPEFAGGGFDTLADNSSFKEAQKYIQGYDYQLTYLNITLLMDYLDRWVRFGMESVTDKEDAGMEDYEMVKRYIKPFKFFIMAANQGSGNEVEMEGFIKIGN